MRKTGRETGYKQGDQQAVRLKNHIAVPAFPSGQSFSFHHRVALVNTCKFAFTHLSSLIENMRRDHGQAFALFYLESHFEESNTT